MSERAGSLYGTTTNFWRQPLSTKVVVGGIIFMVLNLTDAFSTLYFFSLGGEELNPLMRKVLTQGPFIFLTVKYLMVAVPVVGIAAFYHQRREARWAFYVLLLIYLVIVTYQLVMLNVVK